MTGKSVSEKCVTFFNKLPLIVHIFKLINIKKNYNFYII